jgi:hypothetical protein
MPLCHGTAPSFEKVYFKLIANIIGDSGVVHSCPGHKSLHKDVMIRLIVLCVAFLKNIYQNIGVIESSVLQAPSIKILFASK